jgi:LSD1 subclass zinc finger protein
MHAYWRGCFNLRLLPPGYPTPTLSFRFETMNYRLHKHCPGKGSYVGTLRLTFHTIDDAVRDLVSCKDTHWCQHCGKGLFFGNTCPNPFHRHHLALVQMWEPLPRWLGTPLSFFCFSTHDVFQANVECHGSRTVLARGMLSHASNVRCSITTPPSSTDYTPDIRQVKVSIFMCINILHIGYTYRVTDTKIAWGTGTLASKEVSWHMWLLKIFVRIYRPYQHWVPVSQRIGRISL